MEKHLTLVNARYGLGGTNALSEPETANERVIKKVEEKFRTMPAETPEFDHYAASEYLLQNRDATLKGMPELAIALDRFEAIFKQLNQMLPQ